MSSTARRAPGHPPDALEKLTDAQREAVRKWREGGGLDSPQVAALRKRARGESLTEAEAAPLAGATRKASGPGVPHEDVMRELAERDRRGE